MASQHTSIQDLPTEILVLIFNLVSTESQSTRYSTGDPNATVKWPWNDGIPHPAIFPYALVTVCVLWRDILLSFPEFWTRLVVFLDCKFNPSWLSDFRSELAASKDTFIEIFVMRDRSETSAFSDSLEEEHTRAVMDVLSPHVQRCTQLSFDLLHTSSLPLMCDEIGASPHLISLKLNGQYHHERTISGPIISDHITEGGFIFPKLRYLALDGRNFIDACKRFPNWINELCIRDSGFVLSIAHLSRSEGEDAHFSLYDALGCMENLLHLKLKETEFSIERGSHDFQSIDLNVMGLALEGLSCDLIHEFFFVSHLLGEDSESLPDLEITRCPLAAFEAAMEVLRCVTLKHITDSDELLCFFRQHSCYYVVVEDCSGFNDHVLKEISAEVNLSFDVEWDIQVGLAIWDTLSIIDCTDFSMDALKQMVLAHRRGEQPLLELFVYGIPLPSEEDQAWFRDNLNNFSWTL
jgi:hypothetical protein